MAMNTPEPRLPLEPEEYPLYKPPKRIGCSGLSIITILSLLVFAVLISRVTPPIVNGATNGVKQLLGLSTPEPTANTTPGAGGFATQTVLPPTPTTVQASPTPVIEYVQVANTGGQGVRLRSQPQQGASYSVVVGEGAVLMVIGPDQKNSSGTWRNVELPNDGRNGWILSQFLIPAKAP